MLIFLGLKLSGKMFFNAKGKLCYSENPYKLIVEVEEDLAQYYLSLIPKYLRVNRQKYAPHISVVRNETIDLSQWGKYEDQQVAFRYENVIYNDINYFWLNAESCSLEAIRLELGLNPNSEITKSPDGKHIFHITLGNLKK